MIALEFPTPSYPSLLQDKNLIKWARTKIIPVTVFSLISQTDYTTDSHTTECHMDLRTFETRPFIVQNRKEKILIYMIKNGLAYTNCQTTKLQAFFTLK